MVTPLGARTQTAGKTPASNATAPEPAAPSPPAEAETSGTRDVFEARSSPAATRGGEDPIRQRTRQAVDRYTSRLDSVVEPGALALAQGASAGGPPGSLSEAQRDQVVDATKDFVQDLPIGALSPELGRSVQSALEARGVQIEGDLSQRSLSELGSVGGDVAKDLAERMRDERPAAFYGLAAGGAAFAGYTAWDKGSAGLERLGIKPELKLGLFDKHVELKVRGHWDAHLKDPHLSGRLSGNLNLAPGARLSAFGELGGAGLVDGRDARQDRVTLGADLSVVRDQFRLSAGVRHDVTGDRTRATLNAEHRLQNNLSMALSGSYDSGGESRVGVGMRWRF